MSLRRPRRPRVIKVRRGTNYNVSNGNYRHVNTGSSGCAVVALALVAGPVLAIAAIVKELF